MENVAGKFVEKINTHVLCSVTFFFFNHAVYEIIWKEYARARRATDEIIRRMRLACYITKATDTHSEYVILLALPQQQWLCERASIRYWVILRTGCCRKIRLLKRLTGTVF